MLVMSRKVGESIIIDHDIIVTVVSIHNGNRIRVSIQAPEAVRILRAEMKGTGDDQSGD